MLKVILALCLIGSIVNGQVTFPTGTLTANQVYTTNAGTATQTQAGLAVSAAQGYTVGLSTPGWILSNAISTTPGAVGTATVTTIFTTLKRQAGGFVGIGLAGISGTGSQNDGTNPVTCAAFGTSVTGGVAQGRLTGGTTGTTGAAIACPTDFISIYTAKPAASTSVVTAAQLTLAVDTPVKWTITPPTSGGTAASACVAAVLQPYTALSTSGGPTAGTALGTLNSGGTCDATAATRFSALNTGTGVTAATYAFYVELGPSGTAAEVCFQTQAQFTASPGVCSSSIITGVLASVGLLVALLFN